MRKMFKMSEVSEGNRICVVVCQQKPGSQPASNRATIARIGATGTISMKIASRITLEYLLLRKLLLLLVITTIRRNSHWHHDFFFLKWWLCKNQRTNFQPLPTDATYCNATSSKNATVCIMAQRARCWRWLQIQYSIRTAVSMMLLLFEVCLVRRSLRPRSSQITKSCR